MDGQRFDSLTKQVATGVTRRAVAKIVLSGAVAGTLAQRGLRSSAAETVGHFCAEARRGQRKFAKFCFALCRDSPVTFDCV
jgi:hypothetical protein